MRLLLTILYFLVLGQIFGQITIKTEDFNKDGFVDTLTTCSEYIKIVDGKNNKVLQLEIEKDISNIKDILFLPNNLLEVQNESFLEAILEELPKKRKIPDPSLDWIMKSSNSNIKVEGNLFFDLIIDPNTNWSNEFEYPSSYYIDLKNDFIIDTLKEKSRKILIYYGHNHFRNEKGDSLILLEKNDKHQIFQTSHGVLVKKGALYKWVFISDKNITDAPQKLRWESIKKVTLFKKYLLVQQNIHPSAPRLFIINIETGICGRLKQNISVSKDKMVWDEEEKVRYKLKSVFKNLEKNYIKK